MTTAYLDHAASTPMRPEAVAAMVDVLERVPGNPSGQHRWAREARRILDDARDVVADFVGCSPGEVVFTSGGTEADNLAITGIVGGSGGVPLCLATDHHAARRPVEALDGRMAAVHGDGQVQLDRLADLLDATPGASVLSVALANNETGVIQPIGEIAAAVAGHRPACVLHVDAVAGAAWLPLAELLEPAALISVSAHKLGGPKGSGALIVRGDTPLAPLLRGGGQERERRSGTPDVAGAVGFAAALQATAADRVERVERATARRDRLQSGLLAAIADSVATVHDRPDGSPHGPVIANIVHLCVWNLSREALLFRLDEEGIAASAGSSCASGALEESHVLAAMGYPVELSGGALRLSLGWNTTDADVDHALSVIPRVVAELRGSGPVDQAVAG